MASRTDARISHYFENGAININNVVSVIYGNLSTVPQHLHTYSLLEHLPEQIKQIPRKVEY
jgi:hypothetical protein